MRSQVRFLLAPLFGTSWNITRLLSYLTTTDVTYGFDFLLPDVASTVTFHLPAVRRDALHVTRVLPSEQTKVVLLVPFTALTE